MKNFWQKAKFGNFVVVIFIIILSVTGYIIIKSRTRQKVPHILRSISELVFYPSQLPHSYGLDISSIKDTNGVMFYSLAKNASQDIVTVSSQKIPYGFSAKTYFYNQVPEATTLPIGRLYDIGTSKQSRFMVITNDGYLLLITSNAKSDNSLVRELTTNLKLVN